MPGRRNRRVSAEQVAAAFREAKGNMAQAARALEITRESFRRRLRRDWPELFAQRRAKRQHGPPHRNRPWRKLSEAAVLATAHLDAPEAARALGASLTQVRVWRARLAEQGHRFACRFRCKAARAAEAAAAREGQGEA